MSAGADQGIGTADIVGATRDDAVDAVQDTEPTAGRTTDERAEGERTDDGHERPGRPEPAGELFSSQDSTDLERRWTDVQSQFVDDPRDAVAAADHLVAEVMQTLAHRFAEHRETLEKQWGDEGEVDTEELRRAMQQYRSFFHRLLAA